MVLMTLIIYSYNQTILPIVPSYSKNTFLTVSFGNFTCEFCEDSEVFIILIQIYFQQKKFINFHWLTLKVAPLSFILNLMHYIFFHFSLQTIKCILKHLLY